jgi:hypothetical protein
VRSLIALGRFLVLFVSVAAASTPLQALSAKVFVTPVGKDSLTCGALLTPCKTFAGAVAAVSPGGTIIVLTSGEYGPVTIPKALTIEGTGVTALVQTTGTAVTINAGASDVVTLRGLDLTNPGRSSQGILVNSASAVHVEKCTISGFVDAVAAFSWTTGRLFLTDTTARNNDQGLRANTTTSPGLDITIERCVFETNSNGILVQDGTRTVIRGSVASGNIAGLVAQAAFGGSTELSVADCQVSNNTASGVTAEGDSGSAMVRISGSTVTGNQRGLVQAEFGGTSTFLSRGDNTVEGNSQGDLAGTIGTYSGK